MTTDAANRKTGRKRGNNEGTIVQRADGRWTAAVTLPNGKRKWLYGKTRAEVQRKLTATLRNVDQGLPVSTSRQTFSTFLTSWLADSVKPNVRPKTYRAYEQLTRNHIVPALGSLTLEGVTPQKIQAMLNEKRASGLSPMSVHHIHAVTRAALNRAVKWNLIARNPALLIDPPKMQRKAVEAMTPSQALAIVAAMDGTRLEALVTVAVALGLRQGEALALTWDDVDFEARTVRVHRQIQGTAGSWSFVPLKTERSRRTLALPAFVVTALRAHRTRQLSDRLVAGSKWQEHCLIFPTTIGTPREGVNVTHEFQRYIERAELPPMTFHQLRHGCATMLKAKGLGLREIMEVLGHSQISLMANTYTHISPEVMRDAADRMDDVFGAG